MTSRLTIPSSLDELLETNDAAQWLKMKPRRLLADSKGRRPKIPAFWINKRVVRFHPRTILAKFAHDAGIPPEIIGAMFSRNEANLTNQTETPTQHNNHECSDKN